MEKLVLIDGNSLINRAFYAMPVLTTKDGTPTNAVYGFMNMFFKMLSEVKPTFVGVAFDLKAPTFRHKIYSAYKGTRKPMPEELRPQIPLLKEVLHLMGIRTIEKEGSEADDIIGTIAKSTSVQTIIFTGDKDSFQLVDQETEVHFTKRGITDTEIYNAQNFTEKTGITPIQIIQLKALMGDSSDNIPGVSGVGEKTALNLVQTYKNIDNLYANVEDIKGKLKEKLLLGKDSAYLSQTLATIDTKTNIDTDLEKMRFSFPFSSQLREKFIQLEFKSLASKQELFCQNTPCSQSENQKVVTSISIDSLSTLNSLSWSDKTCSFYHAKNLVCVCDGEKEYQIKIMLSLFDDGFSLRDILIALSPLFSESKKLICYSKKELMHLLKNVCDKSLTCFTEDLSLIKYLVDFDGINNPLDVITEYGFSEKTPAFSMLCVYNKLYALFDSQTQDLYQKVELPLVDVLFDMEQAGFKVDVNALNSQGEKYKNQLVLLESQIRELTNEPSLNVNSPKQLGEVLFEKLKVGKGKKTKTGYSTSAEILEGLESSHPAIPLILKYRKIQKLLSTYIEGFKPLVDRNTGLVHTSFNQTVTATGRLSSSEPNLQNIPVRDEEGKELRKFFVPRNPDGYIVSADYSQIELRLLADFSNTPSLINAYKEGKDIHTATASKVFKVDINQVTSALRSKAKAVNFGIIYGISEYGLSKNLKISPSEARNYINSYFEEYKEVKEYMQGNVEFAKKNGYSTTLLGRKRVIKELASPSYAINQFGERVAMNMPLQGSSADIIKLAMLGVAKRLKQEKLQSKLILQVHDELIIDAVASEKTIAEKILLEEMEGAVKLKVNLPVEIGCGKTWFDAK